jgi:hypothetical protein
MRSARRQQREWGRVHGIDVCDFVRNPRERFASPDPRHGKALQGFESKGEKEAMQLGWIAIDRDQNARVYIV